MHPRKALAALIATLVILGLVLLVGIASAVAPVVTIEDAKNIESTTAQVAGTVNPEDHETSYRFEYVPQAKFEATAWAEASQAGSGSAAAGAGVTAVGTELTGLTPHTVYHLRLVAENESGTETATASTFETKVAKPTISNLTVSAITDETAHFSVEIDPGSSDPASNTTYYFYCTSPIESGPFACGGFHFGSTSIDGSPQVVGYDAVSLLPNTEYTVHVVAENAAGESLAAESFKTLKGMPGVSSFAAGPVQSDQVTLNGEVDPRGAATEYWFEWGTKDCSAHPCQKVAVESAGEGLFYKWVESQLTGLEPGSTYHFRIVAENELGVAEGPDEEFTTAAVEEPACPNQGQLGTNLLPDCRAWEMVSPPDKNGINVTPMNTKNHVASDGNAITFSALGSFGESAGSAIDDEYLSRRTAEPGTNGWATHGIYPLARPVTLAAANGNSTSYLNAFSPDLNSAVYKTWRPLTGASNVESVSNLYRINGFAEGPPTSAELLSNANAPVAYKPSPFGSPSFFVDNVYPSLVGASTDISRVFFEEHLPLTADAPIGGSGAFCTEYAVGCPNLLYESTGPQVKLVGRVPASGETFCDDAGGPACEPAPESQAAISGAARGYSERVVSADGRRIYFVANGHLYLREDGERTYEVAESGGVQDVSRDGSRVFFLTSNPLLPADHDGEPDIYMWDREAPAGERLTLISIGPEGQNCYANNLWGTSDDGEIAYFSCSGQLLPGGEPAGSRDFYRWHEGQLRYIANGIFATTNENTYGTGWQYECCVRSARISPDGRYVLFLASALELAGHGGFVGSEDTGTELYLYDAATGRLACASCAPGGSPHGETPKLTVIRNAAASDSTSHGPHALSDDGHYVFFSTEEALVPEDTNGTWDAYEYNSRTGQDYLISSGTSSSPSYFMDATNDGSEVFFLTQQRLSGWDKDSLNDIYVARVDGGLPEPRPVTAPCQGEACLPTAGSLPATSATGSEAAGVGNPPQKCPKGTRRVSRHGSVRCVKKHRHHHRGAKKHRRHHHRGHKHKRAANTNRRAGK